MENHSLFDWISVIGPMILSWPLVIAGALLFFYRPLFHLLEKVSDQDVQKAKIGPLEIEEPQKNYVESLKLLFTSFVSDDELKHLQQLSDEKSSFPYKRSPDLVSDLKRLHSLGFITTQQNLDELPEEGNLIDYVQVSDKGRKYLTLWDSFAENEFNP